MDFELCESIAILRIDDGKANAVSHAFLNDINAGLDRAGQEAKAFILLASDTRIGIHGDFRISLPETAIGLDLPPLLMALTASRLSKRHLTRAAIQAEVYGPETAIDAGFLDEVVAADELDTRALAVATRLA